MSHVDLVRRYFDACTRGDAQSVTACFTPDATVYDTNHPPVRTAEGIGRFWARIHDKWAGATWSVDRAVEQGDAVAVEWTMTGTHEGRPFAVRGSEHYDIRDGRIGEIRQYWTFDPERPGSQLQGYPYDPPG